MGDEGFEVEVERREVFYAGQTVKDVVAALGVLCAGMRRGMSVEKWGLFEEELEKAVAKDVVSIERVKVGGRDGEVEKLVGLGTGAVIVVGRKR